MKYFILSLVTLRLVFHPGPGALAQQGQHSTAANTPHPVQLPNGWRLNPAGKSLLLGDLPLNLAVSPTGRFLAVTNNGQSTQSIQLIDAARNRVISTVVIPKSWLGLKFTRDGKSLYAGGGNDNRILRYAVEPTGLVLRDSLVLGKKWPYKISPAGLDLDEARNLLYVVTKENNSLYRVDLGTRRVLDSLSLGAEAYTCLLSPDRKFLYISLWGGDRILVYNTRTNRLEQSIPVGDNPNDLCLTRNGAFLFVANANDNSVSVIDTRSRNVLETLNTALYPDAPAGSTPNSVALSPDEKTLYIANADNNCLAVFDVSHPGSSIPKGFIPTGWYPTCVRTLGKRILVTNGKGFTSLANPAFDPFHRNARLGYQKGDNSRWYIGGLFQGTLSILNAPGQQDLAAYTRQVYANTPFHQDQLTRAEGEAGNPIPVKVGDASPIRYVFYIIKENRTYDQVLGDLPQGNGDSSLVLFGKNITPNQHAIVQQFVLLDNFYVNAEVSADGHSWSTGAYATDYLEKNWPTSYGGRGGSYDGEGTRLVANNKTYIWDQCRRAGVSYRTYGEFADDYKPNIPVLKDHFCPYYTGWDLSVRDTTRYRQWEREFDSLVANNALPRFNSMRFSNDHTSGLSKGALTPFAQVADNDLAVGMFLQHLSESPVWKESVVFILEDDAQDGPDHVDAHRSTAYVAGGFVKRGYLDHTAYTTASMLRTIELILGLPPMSQYDAAATPMWRCFSPTADLTPYRALPAGVSLDEKNTASSIWQQRSEGFDLAREDRVPDGLFNEVLWKAVRGLHSPMPAPRRAAFIQPLGSPQDGRD
ncbi:MAG TPA: bifunctional YncE family protein/alkaline phosphatase family protein [Chitinophagaceae bacterium]|nr:bifunctional YncE family protein/alkaline phosphatase family protein [Chitinophagaceae bacterium]